MNTQTLCYFRSGIGNFIQCTPALQALASMDQSGKVDVCIDMRWNDYRKDSIIEMLGKFDFVQNIIPFPIGVPVKFEREYQVWYWTSWASNGDALEFFRSKKPHGEDVANDNRVWDHEKTSEADYYFNIVKKYYGYTGDKPPLAFPVSGKFAFNASQKNIVFCNGGFGGYSVIKKWPHFYDLAFTLKGLYGNKINLIKVGYGKELSDVYNYDYDFVNKVSITETAQIIKQSDLLITTDTAIMHIGDALKVPMIVLWGGTSLKKNGPSNDTGKVIHLRLDCQDRCHASNRYSSCTNLRCMNEIRVSMIMREVKELFKGKI
jgi:ADP-heptose:LPS heptosyltransferase